MAPADEGGVEQGAAPATAPASVVPKLRVSGTGYVTRKDGTRVEFTFTSKDGDEDDGHHPG